MFLQISTFLRSLSFWVGLFISTVIWGTLTPLTIVLPIQLRFKVVKAWAGFNLWWLKITCRLSYEIIGSDNIPKTPSIIFSKHQSTWDSLALLFELEKPVFIAKKQLIYIPFFGWVMILLNYIIIDRKEGGKAIKQIVNQAKDRLKDGYGVVIFPEGTRQKVDALPNYRIGGAVASVETCALAVPIAHNAGYFWPRHSFMKYPGTIKLVVLPSISPDGKTPKQLIKEIELAIEGVMPSLRPIELRP